MKHFLLALALLTLTLPALAETQQNNDSGDVSAFSEMIDESLDSSEVYEDVNGEFADLGLIAPEEPGQPEHPRTQPDHRRPRPWHAWTCIAMNRFGQRFVARSFVPGQARSMALRECRRASHPHWGPGCRIVRCFSR